MPSKICKNPDCKTKYVWEKGDPAYPPFRVWCSIDCGVVIGRMRADKAREKKKLKAKRDFDKETQRRKKKIRTKSDWTKRVNTAFNTYIKHRDWDKPCISCNEYEAEPINGVLWDCGHFQPTGSHPELRWCEVNAHRQHSRCNRGAAKHARNDRSVSAQYETNLRARVGDDIVDWLKGPHPALRLLNDELEALEKYYKQASKESKIYLERTQ